MPPRPGMLIVAALALGTFLGCTQIQDWQIDAQYRRRARQAWQAERAEFRHQHHLTHFADGFHKGYYDIASGGTGCPPVLPPRKYWGYLYQSPGGYEKTRQWFGGFEAGVAVAERDGATRWNQIPTSAAFFQGYGTGWSGEPVGAHGHGMPVEPYEQTVPQPIGAAPIPTRQEPVTIGGMLRRGGPPAMWPVETVHDGNDGSPFWQRGPGPDRQF